MATLTRTPTGRLAPQPGSPVHRGELFALWSVAQAEANLAYDAWSAVPGAEAYAAFLAADDRANAAQDALAAFGA